MSNPAGTISGVLLNYVIADAKGVRPKVGTDLSTVPGAKSLTLKLEGAISKGDLIVAGTEGRLSFSATPTGVKKKWDSGMATHVSLARAVLGDKGIDADAKPPAGWKEIAIDAGLYTIWVPEKSSKAVERTNNYRGQGYMINSTTTVTVGDNGLTYRLERATVLVNRIGSKLDSVAIRESLSKTIAETMRGKIVEESDAKMGIWPCKEYVIKGTKETAVVRIVVSFQTVTIVVVHGPAKSVTGDDGTLFLDSFRIHPRDAAAVDPNSPRPMVPAAGNINSNGETELIAGAFDPVFRDYGSEGAFLVGFELGLGKFFNNDVIGAARPIYRSKTGDTLGTAHGSSKDTKTLQAKEGYAVGAITVRSGLTIDGISLTFMKISGTKLDPKDSYESEWFGSPKQFERKLGGTGADPRYARGH